MMHPVSQSLILLASGVAFLVGVAALVSHMFHRAEAKRLVWVACLVAVAVFVISLVSAVPVGIWLVLVSSRVSSAGELCQPQRAVSPSQESGGQETAQNPFANFFEESATLPKDLQGRPEFSSASSSNSVASSGTGGEEDALPLRSWECVLLAVWMLGTALLLLRFILTRLLTYWTCQRGSNVAGTALNEWINRVAGKVGQRGPINVVISEWFSTPVAFGVITPTIGLPWGFDCSLSSPADRAVLLHELKHLISRDPVWRAVAEVVQAILWWHPAVWVAKTRLENAAEEAADESSLWIPNGPRELALGLVFYGCRALKSQLATLGMSGSRERSHLAVRIKRLLSLQKEQSSGKVRNLRIPLWLERCIILVTATAVLFASVGAMAPQVPVVGGGDRMSWLKWCWRHSLWAAAVATFVTPWSASVWAEEPRKPDEPAVAEREAREGRNRPRVEREEGERGPRVQAEERVKEGARERRDQEEPRERPRPPEGGPREERPAAPPVLERIERELNELREEIARAREAGQEERVRALEEQIARLQRIRENVRAGRPPEAGLEREPVPREAIVRQLERRLEELRVRIREAEGAGREEAVRQLREEIERVERALRDAREGRLPMAPPGPRMPVPPGRMERARRAAELLRREGFGDMAELLMRAIAGPPVPPPRPDVVPPPPAERDREAPPIERPRGDRPRPEGPRPEGDRR